MAKPAGNRNETVIDFLTNLDHPLKPEIEMLRDFILASNPEMTENIKWNGPNFCHKGNDRITMRIHPPKQIQLIFHRGAKVLEQPPMRLIVDESGLLKWKANDRAVITFKNRAEILNGQPDLLRIIDQWLKATS